MAEPQAPHGGGATVHSLLEDAHVAHRMVDHPPTYSARADAQATGLPAARVAKTLVTVDHGTYWLAVVPAARRLDLQRMRAALGASSHLRLATEPELADRFPEFDVGAVPPLGRLIGVEEVVDPLLLHEPEMLAAGGDHAHGVLLEPERLVEAVGARVADICEHTEDDRAHRFREAPRV